MGRASKNLLLTRMWGIKEAGGEGAAKPLECGDVSPLWGSRHVAAKEGVVVPPHSKGFALISTI